MIVFTRLILNFFRSLSPFRFPGLYLFSWRYRKAGCYLRPHKNERETGHFFSVRYILDVLIDRRTGARIESLYLKCNCRKTFYYQWRRQGNKNSLCNVQNPNFRRASCEIFIFVNHFSPCRLGFFFKV